MLFFFRQVVVIPFIVTEFYEFWLLENGYFHLCAMIIPLILAFFSFNILKPTIYMLNSGSLITLALKSHCREDYHAFFAALTFLVMETLVLNRCSLGNYPAKCFYNIGWCLALYECKISLAKPQFPMFM